jgi:hypothetical protein
MASEKRVDLTGMDFGETEVLKKSKTIKRLLGRYIFILTIYKQKWPQKAALARQEHALWRIRGMTVREVKGGYGLGRWASFGNFRPFLLLILYLAALAGPSVHLNLIKCHCYQVSKVR